jgi:iron complex outermembrane receptor protein
VDFPRDIEIDGGLRWVDKLIANDNGVPATVPSYFEMDVRLGWHPVPKLEFAIVGQNLLHARHPEYGLVDTVSYREDIQRSVYGKVSYRW